MQQISGDRKKVLITGAGGMLGSALVQVLGQSHDCIALSRSVRSQINREVWIPIDILNTNALVAAVIEMRPDVIINTASSVFVNECERDRSETFDLHVGVTRTLKAASKFCNSQLIYISTDSVFDGRKAGLYKETDATNPLNYYALTKLQGENEALEHQRALVVRSNIFGWRSDGRFSFSEWVLDGLRHRKPLPMFTDVTYTPIATYELARLIQECIREDVTGRFHVGGREYLSKYEFALRVAKAYGLSPEHLVATSIDNVDMGAQRPKNTGLDSSALEKRLGIQMPSLAQSIASWMQKK